MTRQWSLDQEIRLFSLVCDYKPAGEKKTENMAQIVVHINKDTDEPFTADQIWDKLAQHYDLKKVDEIENEEDGEEDSRSDPEKEQLPDIKSEVTADEKQASNTVVDAEENDIAIDSSELSDVEGEEAELAKLEDEQLLAVEDKRSRRKSSPKDDKEKVEKTDKSEKERSDKEKEKSEKPEKEEAGLRKRTRHVAKLDTAESAPKRRLLRASTPPATKRRTRSELVPEEESTPGEENENTEEEEPEPEPEPKTRRSTRQAVRRSVRKR